MNIVTFSHKNINGEFEVFETKTFSSEDLALEYYKNNKARLRVHGIYLGLSITQEGCINV